MAALLLAIVVNSASYIAEIVRGAIDALPKGQWEAAASLSLTRRDTVNDIILPQVFRVVLPSFGNQYISLTKNTALGIAIGYPELFNIYGTIANQTGWNGDRHRRTRNARAAPDRTHMGLHQADAPHGLVHRRHAACRKTVDDVERCTLDVAIDHAHASAP